MKRVLVLILLIAVFITSLIACNSEEKVSRSRLNILVLSEEYKNCIQWIYDNYGNYEYELDISVITTEDVVSYVEESVNNGNIPDVIMAAPETIEVLAANSQITPLENAGLKIDEGRYYDFAIESGKYNGKLYGMCMNASPGVFAYRKSIAEAYLGTSAPDDIELLISDWDSYLDAAQLLKVSSLERTYVSAGTADITRPYFNSNFENLNKTQVKDYFEYVKKLSENKYVFGAEQWSEAWVQGFNDDNAIFGYFLSAIAFDDVLCNVCDKSNGDWNVCVSFSPYSWGGTYLSIHSECQNKEYAAELIKLLAVNEESMKAAALQSGIFTADRNVNKAVCDDSKFSLDLLDGQNYFKILIRAAESIDESGHINQCNDSMYVTLLNTLAENYINGEYDIDTAVDIYFSTVDGSDSF